MVMLTTRPNVKEVIGLSLGLLCVSARADVMFVDVPPLGTPAEAAPWVGEWKLDSSESLVISRRPVGEHLDVFLFGSEGQPLPASGELLRVSKSTIAAVHLNLKAGSPEVADVHGTILNFAVPSWKIYVLARGPNDDELSLRELRAFGESTIDLLETHGIPYLQLKDGIVLVDLSRLGQVGEEQQRAILESFEFVEKRARRATKGR
jgi:hypothetical protein